MGTKPSSEQQSTISPPLTLRIPLTEKGSPEADLSSSSFQRLSNSHLQRLTISCDSSPCFILITWTCISSPIEGVSVSSTRIRCVHSWVGRKPSHLYPTSTSHPS